MYVVSGTQADRPSNNRIYVMKMSSLHRTKHDDDENDNGEVSDSDDEEDDEAVLESQSIPHHGGVNRIRVCSPLLHILMLLY